MSEIVKSYNGNGNFICDSGEYNSNFSIVQYSDSTILIKWQHNDIINIEPTSRVSMQGDISIPEGKIEVTGAYVQEVKSSPGTKIIMKSIKPVEIKFKGEESIPLKIRTGLTNLVFKDCEEISSNSNGINIEIDPFNANLIRLKDYDEKLKKLEDKKENVVVTSEMEITFNESVYDELESIINNMSYLLSYSSRNVVSPIYSDYLSDETIIKTILRPLLTRDYNAGDTLIDFKNFAYYCDIKDFLETSYPNFVEYKNKLALNIVISFYLEAVTLNYIDMGFLLNSTAMETLLSGYADMRKLEGTPIVQASIESNIKKVMKIFKEEKLEENEEIVKKIVQKVSYSNLNVREKLSALIKDPRFELKLDSYDWDFTEIRNGITHTGKFPDSIKASGRTIDILEEHNRLIYLTDRIILTILGYKGKPFLNRANNYQRELLK